MIFAMLAACTQHQPGRLRPGQLDGCQIEEASPLAADDPGDVGRSAKEVAALLDGAVLEVEFVSEDPALMTTSITTSVEIALSLAGEVEQQERSALALSERCVEGIVGYAPVDAAILGEDVWTTTPARSPRASSGAGPRRTRSGCT